MEHEIRYYLRQTKTMMHADTPFIPTYLILAVKMPTGAIQIDMNSSDIEEKIDFILEAYDEDMHNKNNPDMVVQNIMIV